MNLTIAKQAESLFHQALECAAAEREAFLLKACDGDSVLYAEVSSLLAAHEDGIIPSIPILELLAKRDDEQNRASTETLTGADPLKTTRSEADNSDPEVFSLAEGAILAERYQLEKEIGRGGFGLVFLARDRKLEGAKVVIKVLMKSGQSGLQSFWAERKFRDEIAALARINHPGVVRALDVGELPDGRLWLAMQYIHGITLREALLPYGMELKQVAELMRQIGNALAAAHSQGVLHRDLKPENIMLERVGSEDQVRLVDFGIASITDAASGGTTTIPAGTLRYAAPEQLSGRSSIASDVYSLGVIAYEMITGCCPFALSSDRNEVQALLGVSRPKLPLKSQNIILKAISFDPKDRFQNARDFTDLLASSINSSDCSRISGEDNFTPLRAIGCKLWVEARLITDLNDEDGVETWNDHSGNNNALTQSNSDLKPIFKTNILNGLPVLRFDGIDDYLELTDILSGACAGEVFLLFKLAHYPPIHQQDGLWCMSGETTHATNFPYHGDKKLYESWGTTARKRTGVKPPALNKWRLYNVSSSDGHYRICFGDKEYYSSTTNTFSSFISETPCLGRSLGIYGNAYLVGDIAALIIFDSVLSSADRKYIKSGLASVYGLNFS